VIRLFAFFVMLALTLGGVLYVDYHKALREAGRDDGGSLTVSEYLGRLPSRVSGLAATSSASGLPTKLAEMLPKAPDGWTVRSAVAEDTDGFLPKNAKKADKAALAYVRGVAQADEKGAEAVVLTYEKGDRKVLIKATRYPNGIFTDPTLIERRYGLQMTGPAYRGTEFMTVRGLDVAEDLLPEGFRGRYFLADVGGQIHLRVLAPRRMTETDLAPFFETLHVKAMNASVVDRREGLGEVPVMVLAAALDGPAREAYVADLAVRKAAQAGAYEAAFHEAQAVAAGIAAEEEAGGGLFDGLFGSSAEAAPEVQAEPETSIACDNGKNGVKRCKVVTGAGE
jgi:hypothetical protein